MALEPTHLLSNGRYSVTLRANGAGWSRLGAAGITRWRDDVLRDACGSFVYLRLKRHATPVSVTRHPAPDPAATYQSTFQQDRVCFEAHWPGLRARTTVWVSPEDDIEFRKVVLNNRAVRKRASIWPSRDPDTKSVAFPPLIRSLAVCIGSEPPGPAKRAAF